MKWTENDVIVLKEKYFGTPKQELQKLLPNRTWRAIVSKAKKLKLRRTDNEIIRKSIRYRVIEGTINKLCPNCHRYIPLDKYHFFVDNSKKLGYRSRCKECEIKEYNFGDKVGLFNIRWDEVECLSGIYKITNRTTKKIYIGSATNFCRRWSAHYSLLRRNKHENEYLQNAWNKYGENDFVFEILEYVEDKKELLSREQYWLDFTRCYDRKIGFNIDTIAGNSLGRKTSHKTKEKLKRVKNKQVEQFDCNGVYIKEWISVNEVSRVLGYSCGNVCNCCNHKLLQYKNSIWIYKDKVEQEGFRIDKYVFMLRDRQEWIQNNKRVNQYTLDGVFLKQWKSIKVASDELKIRDYDILQCCKKKMSSYCNYIWRFLDECYKNKIKVENLKSKIVYQYNRNRLVKTWYSIKEVGEFLNIPRHSLSKELK